MGRCPLAAGTRPSLPGRPPHLLRPSRGKGKVGASYPFAQPVWGAQVGAVQASHRRPLTPITVSEGLPGPGGSVEPDLAQKIVHQRTLHPCGEQNHPLLQNAQPGCSASLESWCRPRAKKPGAWVHQHLESSLTHVLKTQQQSCSLNSWCFIFANRHFTGANSIREHSRTYITCP